MGKKNVKKTHSTSSKCKNDSENYEPSPSKKLELGCNFKVSLVSCTDEPKNYYKWIKDCSWENVAFVHPSVIFALRCDFLLIKGRSATSIFIPYSLKTVKKSSVVFLENMGFEHEEDVSIHPFKGTAYEARDICVHLQPDIELSESIKDLVWKELSIRFIWPNLKIKVELYEIKYEVTIISVHSTSQIVVRNFYQQTFCDEEYGSFDTSQLSSCASNTSMIKPDSFVTFSSVESNDFSKGVESSDILTSQEEICAFFVLTYETNITFSNEIASTKLVPFPLTENISTPSDKMQSAKKTIDEIFTSFNQKALNHHVLLLVASLESEIILELKTICSEYNLHVEEIILSRLYFKDVADLLEEMKRKFRIANERATCILILNKFADLYTTKSQHPLISDTLSNLIETCDAKILIVASVVDSSKYDKKIFSSCCVQEVIISSPTTEEIMQKSLEGMKHNLTDCQMKQCAQLSQGLTREELCSVLKYAELLSLIRIKNMPKSEGDTVENNISFCDIKTAMKKKKPSIMSSDLSSKKVRWKDIGGMTEIKEKLKEEIELFQICPQNIKRFNYEPSKGILLYGPPGCSKTMIAQALANECNWNFISKKSSDILNMYVGESEKAVTKLFLDARARSPCIIFLDEIDALAPERTSCSTASGVQNRVVNALLTEIAGIETLKNIMVIAATNRPDVVDKAFLRSGRIGLHIYVPLPDSESRKEIFKLCLKRRCVASDVDLNILVERTNGYTGAEIVHVCNEAAMQLLTDDKLCKSPFFTMSHFERALHAVPPRTTKEAIQFYEQFSSR